MGLAALKSKACDTRALKLGGFTAYRSREASCVVVLLVEHHFHES